MPKSAAKAAKSKRPSKAKKPTEKYEDIRRELQRQRVALLNEAVETLANRHELAAFPDLGDQASAEMDQNFELRLKEREQKLLKKIDEALERLAANTYGICESCGQEIPYKRLKARPVTTLCIECKTQQELEEKIRQ